MVKEHGARRPEALTSAGRVRARLRESSGISGLHSACRRVGEQPCWGAATVPVEQVHPPALEPPPTALVAGVGGLPVLEHPEVLHRHGRRVAGSFAQQRLVVVRAGGVEVDRALGREFFEGVGLLGVGGRDDVALVVLGDREQAEHFVHRLAGHADGLGDGVVGVAAEVDISHVERIAASLRTQSTGTVSPAVNRLARYSTGIRRASMAAKRLPRSSASSRSP